MAGVCCGVNLSSKGGLAGLGWLCNFGTPCPSLKRVKLGTWNLVCGQSMSRTSLSRTIYHQMERGPRHMTDFGILAPLLISETAEGSKLKFCIGLDYVRYTLINGVAKKSHRMWPFWPHQVSAPTSPIQ